uniref:Uncharacterized protein n=1 Tax=Pipistrellus kuhlii TaxID=59472 RepID=A0A7J7WDA7_PIPKU|nr:hypothetical protein mPipKuh1_007999 [Pipistrellus kuhlii]
MSLKLWECRISGLLIWPSRRHCAVVTSIWGKVKGPSVSIPSEERGHWEAYAPRALPAQRCLPWCGELGSVCLSRCLPVGRAGPQGAELLGSGGWPGWAALTPPAPVWMWVPCGPHISSPSVGIGMGALQEPQVSIRNRPSEEEGRGRSAGERTLCRVRSGGAAAGENPVQSPSRSTRNSTAAATLSPEVHRALCAQPHWRLTWKELGEVLKSQLNTEACSVRPHRAVCQPGRGSRQPALPEEEAGDRPCQ